MPAPPGRRARCSAPRRCRTPMAAMPSSTSSMAAGRSPSAVTSMPRPARLAAAPTMPARDRSAMPVLPSPTSMKRGRSVSPGGCRFQRWPLAGPMPGARAGPHLAGARRAGRLRARSPLARISWRMRWARAAMARPAGPDLAGSPVPMRLPARSPSAAMALHLPRASAAMPASASAAMAGLAAAGRPISRPMAR